MYLVFYSFLGFSAKVVKIMTIGTKFALPKRSQVQFELCRKIIYNVLYLELDEMILYVCLYGDILFNILVTANF